MPIDTHYNQKLNTMVRTVSGKLSVTAIKQAIVASLTDADFKKNMNVIWDITAADVSDLTTDQLMEVVGYIDSHSSARGADYAIAIVAPEDLAFGISRMFEGHSGGLAMSVCVLRSLEEALAWIEERAV